MRSIELVLTKIYAEEAEKWVMKQQLELERTVFLLGM